MVCSAECTENVGAREQVHQLRDTVNALERLAAGTPQDSQRDRARERLKEITDATAEPGRTRAREALRRIGSRQDG